MTTTTETTTQDNDTVVTEPEPTNNTVEPTTEPTNVPTPPKHTPADDTPHICTCNGNAPLCTGHWPVLSRRETEILDQIARGASYTDIATHFAITLDTVKTIMHRVHKKLGARNSPHAVSIALALRVICTSEADR